jgi:hypothetical protein
MRQTKGRLASPGGAPEGGVAHSQAGRLISREEKHPNQRLNRYPARYKRRKLNSSDAIIDHHGREVEI